MMHGTPVIVMQKISTVISPAEQQTAKTDMFCQRAEPNCTWTARCRFPFFYMLVPNQSRL